MSLLKRDNITWNPATRPFLMHQGHSVSSNRATRGQSEYANMHNHIQETSWLIVFSSLQKLLIYAKKKLWSIKFPKLIWQREFAKLPLLNYSENCKCQRADIKVIGIFKRVTLKKCFSIQSKWLFLPSPPNHFSEITLFKNFQKT